MMMTKDELHKHKVTALRLRIANNEAGLKKALKGKHGDLAYATVAVIEELQRELGTLDKGVPDD